MPLIFINRVILVGNLWVGYTRVEILYISELFAENKNYVTVVFVFSRSLHQVESLYSLNVICKGSEKYIFA